MFYLLQGEQLTQEQIAGKSEYYKDTWQTY